MIVTPFTQQMLDSIPYKTMNLYSVLGYHYTDGFVPNESDTIKFSPSVELSYGLNADKGYIKANDVTFTWIGGSPFKKGEFKTFVNKDELQNIEAHMDLFIKYEQEIYSAIEDYFKKEKDAASN